MLHELPLVIFTIAAQMSAGSFIVLGLIHLLGAKVPQETMDRVTDPALYAVGPLLVLGMAASTLHLGSPLRAANSLLHLGGSWLSAEIFAGSAFAGLGAVFAFLQWKKLGPHVLRQVLAVLTAAVGAFLVFAISQVYSLRTVPAWATYFTPVRFFITALLLGGLAVGAALVIAAQRREAKGVETPEAAALVGRSVRGIALGGLFGLGAKYIGQPAYIGYLGTHPEQAARESLDLLVNTYGVYSAAQNILTFAGIAALFFMLYRMADGNAGKRLMPTAAIVAFVLVLAGEVIGRMLFYASMVRIGV
nr:dimethyl sulfoxide reductase anchor subunit [Propionibacterium sp.]